jgi:hypothetical protein
MKDIVSLDVDNDSGKSAEGSQTVELMLYAEYLTKEG